jgi:hypothetical protein
MAAILGSNTSGFNQRYANLGDDAYQRVSYLLAPDLDPVTRAAWTFRDYTSYTAVTYGKSATLLSTLEGIIGSDTMDEAMRTYFQRYRFTHPTTEDFLRTIEQVAVVRGKAAAAAPQGFGSPSPLLPSGLPDFATAPVVNSSLRPFINQAVYGTEVMDYSVDRFTSEPAHWWLPHPEDKSPSQYLSTVYLRRRTDFIFPVTAEVIFDDGTRLREHWDGIERWARFSYTRNAKIVSVELDPDHTVPLDRDLFNNSFRTQIDPVPARKLTSIWVILQQLAAQLVAWIV